MWWVLFVVTLGAMDWPSLVVEGANCSTWIVPKILTARVGNISTPNFPHKFPIPYCERWVIDAGPIIASSPKYIHIYYTQPYFKLMIAPNFKIGFHDYFPFNDTSTNTTLRSNSNLKSSATKDNRITKSRESQSQSHKVKRWDNPRPVKNTKSHPHNLLGPLGAESTDSPTQRYMSVEVRINSLYNTHFRARDSFLHVYGFNLTYEINNSSTPREKCSIYTCRAAGNCYAASDYKSFFCGCQEGRTGQYCEYSSICDPKTNINPCLNGGSCETMAPGSAFCYCRDGFIGQDCSRRNATFVKACPGPDCQVNCDSAVPTNRPCSCHNGTKGREGWIRYEGEFVIELQNQSYPLWNMKSDPNSLTEEDLKIKTNIESHLTEKLRKSVKGFEKMDRVSVVSFGPDSRFDFQFFGPPDVSNDAQLALNQSYEEEVYPGIKLKTMPKFRPLPALLLQDVTIKPKGTIKVGDNYSITCSAIGSSNITFKWFKNESPIDVSLAIGGRITEMPWRQESTFQSTSTLNFDKAHVNDRGTFTCQVSDTDQEQCKDLEMVVLTKPAISVRPMSLTLMKNTLDTIITCSAALDSVDRNWGYDWKINGALIDSKSSNEVKEELFPRGSLLRIIKAEVSKTYTCVVANQAGVSTMDIRVEVLEYENSPSCPKQVAKGLVWEITAPTQTAKRLCPSGYTGFAQRTCERRPDNIHPIWIDADFSRCVSLNLKAMNESVQNAKLGFTNRTHLSELVKQISAHLIDKDFLYLGEGERIITILSDIGYYAVEKLNTSDTKFFELFLNTTTTFLTFQESCFYERSVISLCNLIYRMTANYSSSNEFSFQSDQLIVEGPKMRVQDALIFPKENIKYPSWLDIRVEVPNWEGNASNFVVVVLRNLMIPLTTRERVNSGSPYSLISSLVYINSNNYDFYQTEDMILHFKISTEWTDKILSKRINITCGALDNNPFQSMSWNRVGCYLFSFSNQTAECHCNRFGQYGLLSYLIDHEKVPVPLALHWSVLFGCIICIICCTLALTSILVYSQCQFVTNSIYLLKIVVCFSLIMSILFILSMRPETKSIPLTTCVCTFIIFSLACHLTKSLKVYLNSSRINPFPWLQSVPLLNLLLGITFGCVLPLWTSAAAMLHSSLSEEDLAFDERSPILGTFVGTLVLILILFLYMYYKAYILLQTNRNFLEIHILNYRIKTLNRALAITLSTIITALSAILRNSFCSGIPFQYFFGFSTFTLGIIVFVSYTIKSEYPIPGFIANYFICNDPTNFPDPEKPPCPNLPGVGIGCNNSTPDKRYPIENGQLATVLLPNQQRCTSGSRNSSEPETTMETFASSSICSSKPNRASSSASSTKRPSFGSSKLSRSFTDPPFMNHYPMKKSRKFAPVPEWHNLSNTSSMSGLGLGGSSHGMIDRPQRGKCLLRDTTAPTNVHVPPSTLTSGSFPMLRVSIKDTGEYVTPNIAVAGPSRPSPNGFDKIPSEKYLTSNPQLQSQSQLSSTFSRKPKRDSSKIPSSEKLNLGTLFGESKGNVKTNGHSPNSNSSSHFKDDFSETFYYKKEGDEIGMLKVKTEEKMQIPLVKNGSLMNGCAAGISTLPEENVGESLSVITT